MRATLSILGLYNANEHLFDGIRPFGELLAYCEDEALRERLVDIIALDDDPETWSSEAAEEDGRRPLSRTLLIERIWLECAELEVLYPDAAFMQQAIAHWWRSKKLIWARLMQTVALSYDPIANYDRTETDSSTETRDLKRRSKVKDSQRDSYAAGYDSSDLEHTGRETSAGSSVDKDTGTVTYSKSNRVKGNIGVTTTQQMIAAEREAALFDLYAAMVKSFKETFCLLIY